MGFGVNKYCTVWSVEPKGNITKVRLSSQSKNRETQQYEQDFSGFCVFIGNANKNAANLNERDRIKILDCEVQNRYDKEARREYIDYRVFDFETVSKSGTTNNSTPPANKIPAFVEDNSVESDDLPF